MWPFFEVCPSVEWSDDLARQTARQTELPTNLHDDNAIVLRCARFLEFYSAGTVREEDSTLAIIADMAFTAYGTEGFIFQPGKPLEDEENQSSYGVNKSSIEKLEIKSPAPVKAVCPRNMRQKENNLSKIIIKYDEKRLEKFVEHIADRLNPMLAGEFNLVELKKITSVLSYLALTMFRGVIKEHEQLAFTYNTKSFSKNLYAATCWNLSYPISPPCESALKKAALATYKIYSHVPHLFAKIVVTWLDLQKEPNSNAALFLSSAVLDVTKFNGISIIGMVLKCEKIPLDRETLLQHSLYAMTKLDWISVIKFLKSNIDGNKNLSACWARVIDHNYFQDLATKRNSCLAGILAGIIMENEGDGIKRAQWIQKRPKEMKHWVGIGKKIYEKLTSKSVSEGATLSEKKTSV